MDYKTLLGSKLNLTQDREMFTAVEVRDMLLDLWLAADESLPEPVPA